MAKIRSDTQWLKRMVIPFWVLQTLIMLLNLAGCIIGLGALNYGWFDTTDDDWDDKSYGQAAFIVGLVVTIIALFLTILEIIFYVRQRMTPRFYLVTGFIKSLMFLCLSIWDDINVLRDNSHKTGPPIIPELAILFFVIPTIYALVLLQRPRNAVYQEASGGDNVDLENLTTHSPPFLSESATPQTATGGTAPRRLSYNHQRDTRFEEYRSRSLSQPERPADDIYEIPAANSGIPRLNIEPVSDDERDSDNSHEMMRPRPEHYD